MAGWTKCAARVLHAIADALTNDALRAPKTSQLIDVDELQALTSDMALSLFDEDLHGFLIVKLIAVDGELRLGAEHLMPQVAWPKVRAYLAELQEILQ